MTDTSVSASCNYQTVGTCSICGGEVIGFQGVWMSILQHPPATCSRCGATAAQHGPVIPMVHRQTPVLAINYGPDYSNNSWPSTEEMVAKADAILAEATNPGEGTVKINAWFGTVQPDLQIGSDAYIDPFGYDEKP